MGWLTKVIVLAALQYISPSGGVPYSYPTLPPEFSIDDDNFLESTGGGDILSQDSDFLDDDKLRQMSALLAEVLLRSPEGHGLPILYVENLNEEDPFGGRYSMEDGEDDDQLPEATLNKYKRSRYYRKYPWKRQNSRGNYNPSARMWCQPSKDETLLLLQKLHEARQGKKGQIVEFCNRKRPASSIITNIRFLG